jgi:hypothetical protein
VAVIFAVMAGGQLFGFLGMPLALPVAAVTNVLLRYAHQRYRRASCTWARSRRSCLMRVVDAPYHRSGRQGPRPEVMGVPQPPLALHYPRDQRLETFIGAPDGALAQLRAIAVGASHDWVYLEGAAEPARPTRRWRCAPAPSRPDGCRPTCRWPAPPAACGA